MIPILDEGRKGTVIKFLHDSGLIEKGKCIIDLSGVDLRGAVLGEANLSKANLSGANLTRAILERANLKGVTGITVEQLESQAKSLQGATMPDGSIHP